MVSMTVRNMCNATPIEMYRFCYILTYFMHTHKYKCPMNNYKSKEKKKLLDNFL